MLSSDEYWFWTLLSRHRTFMGKKSKQEKKMMNLGYRESNPGLMSKLSLLRSESHRCYRYTIPD